MHVQIAIFIIVVFVFKAVLFTNTCLFEYLEEWLYPHDIKGVVYT